MSNVKRTAATNRDIVEAIELLRNTVKDDHETLERLEEHERECKEYRRQIYEKMSQIQEDLTTMKVKSALNAKVIGGAGAIVGTGIAILIVYLVLNMGGPAI